MDNRYALILAGGKGTRFWPKSREKFPKQFLSLDGDKSFLQLTFERICRFIPEQNIYIVTTHAQSPLIQQQLPSIKSSRIVIEPVGRNTCPAIALGVSYIRKENPAAVVLVAPSDQLIQAEDVFAEKAAIAMDYAAHHKSFVVFGIKPAYAHTGYGYIKSVPGHDEIRKVDAFVEKPAKSLAEAYLQDPNYSWNSGMFVFSLAEFFHELKLNQLEMYRQIDEISSAIGTPQEHITVERVYPHIQSVSIDYGIMEHANSINGLSLDVGWNDVGSWASLYDVLALDDRGNHFQVSGSVALDSTGVIAQSGKLVATLGIKDVILVETDDVILLCHKDNSQDIKYVLDSLRASGRADLL